VALPLPAAAGDLAAVTRTTEPAGYLGSDPRGVASKGDVRVFHFDGKTADDYAVITDWITTGPGTVKRAHSWVTEGIFSLVESHADQGEIQAAGIYPNEASALMPASKLSHTIVDATVEYGVQRKDARDRAVKRQVTWGLSAQNYSPDRPAFFAT